MRWYRATRDGGRVDMGTVDAIPTGTLHEMLDYIARGDPVSITDKNDAPSVAAFVEQVQIELLARQLEGR